MQFLCEHWLDMLTTALGLAYILLEYRASIWLWAVGFAMQSLGIVLYYQKGLYADCGMEFYFLAMTIYGFRKWRAAPADKHHNNQLSKQDDNQLSNNRMGETPITHFPLRLAIGWAFATCVAWGALYWFLSHFTDSTVPMADSFTTALSFVGIWALARKYLEQWIIWIVVDVVTCVLYFYKDIPFKASLYALYVIIAVMGYFKWKKMMKNRS